MCSGRCSGRLKIQYQNSVHDLRLGDARGDAVCDRPQGDVRAYFREHLRDSVNAVICLLIDSEQKGYGTKLYVITPLTFTGLPIKLVGENDAPHAASRAAALSNG